MKHFSYKKLSALVVVLLVAGCGTVQSRRPELNPNLAKNGTAATKNYTDVPAALKPDEPAAPSNIISAPETVVNQQAPALTGESPLRVGIVLGPGGMRAYSHIGVIQELSKAKVPIVAISGIEMGALVGGIFANKGQTYDVEWQMMKIHEDELFRKNLVLARKPQDVSALSSFLQTALTSVRAEDAKIPFACPAFNVAKRQTFMMSRGQFVSMLPYCLPFSPFFRAFEQNVAGVTSVAAAAKFVRSKGANYLIYVDLLGEKSIPFFAAQDEEANIGWNVVAESIDPQLVMFNRVISVPLANYYLNDFEKRREMIQRGQDAGKSAARDLQSEFGL